MGSVSCRDSNFVKRSEDDAWTTPTPSLFIMQPSVTAFSSLPVSYLHRTLQCYRDFMCQAGNTDTANSKPSQKCQIHPPSLLWLFLLLSEFSAPASCFAKEIQDLNQKFWIQCARSKSDWLAVVAAQHCEYS